MSIVDELAEAHATISDLRHQLEVRADENQRLEYELRNARAEVAANIEAHQTDCLPRIAELEAERDNLKAVLNSRDLRAQDAEAERDELNEELGLVHGLAERIGQRAEQAEALLLRIAEARRGNGPDSYTILDSLPNEIHGMWATQRAESDRADEAEAEAARYRAIIEQASRSTLPVAELKRRLALAAAEREPSA